MSFATFLSPELQTSPGVLNSESQFRLLGGSGSTTAGRNISRFWGTMVSGGGIPATFTADCANITFSSQVVITQAYNFTTSANPAGTLSVIINPTGGTGGRGSFTVNSTSASDVGLTVVYFVDG